MSQVNYIYPNKCDDTSHIFIVKTVGLTEQQRVKETLRQERDSKLLEQDGKATGENLHYTVRIVGVFFRIVRCCFCLGRVVSSNLF